MRKMILFTLTACATTMAIAADPAPRAAPHEHEARPDFAQMRARHADDVALLIGLRPDQRPALDAFLATIMPHGEREGGEGHPAMGDMPAPPAAEEGTLARLDRMSAHVDRANVEAKQRIEATRKFYASLTPDQQRRFDALERLHHGAMHERMGMRGHGRPEGDRGPDRKPPAD
ncbi:MAG TPA: Spy/CpxP family protein refolding chaperone [Sphingomonas sp.]|nr:Spy/CpxP family protein refolding chaperone [Sphingomonas sp.]